MDELIDVSFVVNGKLQKLKVREHWTLLRVLREQLGVTSVREGCAEGECGACTVLLNGNPVPSCLVLAATIDEKDEVTTLEGISEENFLHPLQEAFHKYGAVQCGFCTPGMILSAKSLLDRNPKPTREEIQSALAGNLCRCTGYLKPIEAIYGTSRGYITPEEKEDFSIKETTLNYVGKRIPRIEGEDLVTARVHYVDDLVFPRMLHAKSLLSKHHHALIRRIDVTKAERLPGVAAVITAKDVPNNIYGRFAKDQPCLCQDKVRYLGDIIAVVAAEDPDIAEEAVELIDVEYEELPAIFDPIEAMKPEAIKIHPHGNLVPFGRNNRWQIRKGNIDEGLRQADLVLEDTYTTGMNEHVHIEPHVAIGMVDPQGIIVIYSSLQGPFVRAPDIAYILNKPLSKIRIIVPAVGGGFGGKNDTTIEPHVALLALKTGRPVKWRWTRKEEFLCSSVRHPFIMRHEIGLKKDGTIIAKRVNVIQDIGAYCTVSPLILEKVLALCTGPYRVPHVWADGYLVYTNKQIGGAMRGFGITQENFALEAQLDTAAKELGIDPMEIRLKNALVEGDSIAVGQKPKAVSIKPCLEKVAQAVSYTPGRLSKSILKRYARGWGISALLYTASILNIRNPSNAIVSLNTDGSIVVQTGSTDVGQGSKTVLAQMAAEILGIPLNKVSVTTADTHSTPYDMITASSRVTFVTGNAVVQAAQEVRKKLAEAATELIEANPEDLKFANGKIYIHDSVDKFITVAEAARHIFQKTGEIVMGKGHFSPPQVPMDIETGQGEPTPCYTYGAAAAEVEVDRETGYVRILGLTACFDCGQAINPLLLEGQIDGGLIAGIGFTLMEDMYPQYPSVDPSAFDLGSYLIPTAADIPEKVQTLIHESQFPMGPFGVKGVGESFINVVAPAIVNAIYDAVGIRAKNLPLTSERLLQAMREQKESSK
jgi:xanthine dehydrogenase molybdenum-binding subunit